MQRDPRQAALAASGRPRPGGSALQGETPLDCARRELLEETGIAAGELRELGRVVCEENRSVYVDFLCLTDWDKQDVRLQAGETSAFRWAFAEEIARMGQGRAGHQAHAGLCGRAAPLKTPQAPGRNLPAGGLGMSKRREARGFPRASLLAVLTS